MKKLRIMVDGKKYDVEVEILEDDDDKVLPSYYYQNVPKGFAPQANVPQAAPMAAPPIAPKPRPTSGGDGKNLTSPINGVVLEIPVKAGQSVNENDVVVVLEAMKMKTNISSPFAGTIKSIEVNVGDRVETGQLLVAFN